MSMQDRAGQLPADGDLAPDVQADQLAARLTASAQAAVRQRGRCVLVLGVSPLSLRVCRHWAQLTARAAFWPYTVVFLADEVVSDGVPIPSSLALLRAVLFDRVAIPQANVHAVDARLPPVAGAAAFERALRMTLELRPGELPRFDLVLLGLDPDLRRSGLYPRTWAGPTESRLVLAVPGRLPGTTNVVLTALALASTLECVIVTSAEAPQTRSPADDALASMEQLLALMGTPSHRVVLATSAEAARRARGA